MKPNRLRDQLFSALAQNDLGTFTDLCERYESLILENFPAWTKVPEAIRKDSDARNAWGQSIIFIAEYFQEIGHPELLDRLTGGPDNPLIRWPRVFSEASQLSESGQNSASTSLLLGILPELEGASGSGVDDIRPKVYGLLGSNYFRIGDIARARRFTELARADSERSGDRQQVSVYSETLRLLKAAEESGPASGQTSAAARVRARIARAQDLSDDVRYESSNAILREIVAEMDHLPSSLIDEYRGKAYGLLGLNFFRLADLAQARHYTELALQNCTRVGDEEGARIYSFNLQVISEA